MTELRGELEAYYEQGWEGRIEFAFQFEGNQKPFFLEKGQHLTIYKENGDVLWSGKINFVRKNNWFDKHKLNANIWSWTKQKGVSYADWMEWFWHKPPLKAKLIVEKWDANIQANQVLDKKTPGSWI